MTTNGGKPKVPTHWSHRVIKRQDIRDGIRFAVDHFLRSQLPVMAAALSYRTIFGLVPAIVIALVIVKTVATDDQVGTAVRTVLERTGLTQVEVKQEPMGPPAPGAPAEPVPQAPAATGSNQQLDKWIGDLVANLSKIPVGAIGLIGSLALFYAAISMLVEVERAFNQIYRAPTGRSWGSRVARYWAMLTLGTVFLALTFVMTERATTWVQDIAESGVNATGFSAGPLIKAAGFYFVTVVTATTFLVSVYVMIPNAPVRFRPALYGAIVAAILWEAGKWGFAQYLRASAGSSYGRLYGSIALIPVFMLWVYMTWIVILLGLYIAYSLQIFKERPLAQLVERPPPIVDPASILLVLGAISEQFNSGKKSDPSEIAQVSGLDAEVVTAMMERLAEVGILHRVRDVTERAGYTLARPPSAISTAEVLKIGNELAGKADKNRAPKSIVEAVERVKAAGVKAAENTSIAQIIGTPGEKKDAPASPGTA